VRAALYARCSTEEQTQGYSLDAQRRAFREYCDRQGWVVAAEYVEEHGASGRSADRPEFKAMLEGAQQRRFDVLVVHKLDRFSRSLRDTISYITRLHECGVSFVSVQEQFDFTTPAGRLQMHILAAIGQWYSDNLSQEIKKGLSERARQGYWVGPLSTGYCTGLCSTCKDECPLVGGEDIGDGRTPIPHPRDSEAIRLAFQLYSTGNHSYRTILQELNSQGYTTNRKEGRRRWTKEALKHTLGNPFYIGKVRHKGKLNQGRHEPLVDRELFYLCQEVKRLHGRSPRTYVAKFRTYTFSGVLYCAGCGERMRADYATGHKYYRCASRGRGIDCPAPRSRVRGDGLERQMGHIIRSLRLPPTWQDRVAELYGAKDERDRILGEQKRLREKLRRLKTSYHEVEISEKQYRAEKARTERKLAGLRLPEESRLEEVASVVQTLAASWDCATAEERRDMVRLIFDAVYCDPSAKRLVALQPKPDFLVLFRGAGMLQEKEGLVWPSATCGEQVGISAPDWTRTSTPSRAQALNLPRIPIPPQGL
jgi:site-specific DNA recombinase